MKYDCLIIDDETELADNTAEYFNMFGVESKAVYTAEDAIDFLEKNSTKLILLDINLGDSSGFELCKRLRKEYDIPILFISARSSDDDMVIALNIGGDDYITKPYSLSVLYAKVKVVLKRYEKMEAAVSTNIGFSDGSQNNNGSSSQNQGVQTVFTFGKIVVDTDAGIVRKCGEIMDLTAMEYKLLLVFINHAGEILDRDQILNILWDDVGSFVNDNTLTVYIKRLRSKLGDEDGKYIETIRGQGYRLNL